MGTEHRERERERFVQQRHVAALSYHVLIYMRIVVVIRFACRIVVNAVIVVVVVVMGVLGSLQFKPRRLNASDRRQFK